MKWLFGLTVGVALLGAVGCGVDSGDTSTGGGGAGGAACEDDPASGPVVEECGIWVSVSQGDDANPGTPSAPVASLAHAVELAAKGPGHVYACAETWTDPLVVPGHVRLHGGFDCENGWAYLGKERRSMLVTPADEIALIVSDDGNGGETKITDFHIEAADATKPSGSSIAVFVRDQVPLWLYRCEIFAGNGADGLDGDAIDTPAPAGLPGNVGADACSAAMTKGGAAPEVACESGGTSKGGAGGDSASMSAANGAAGEAATGNPDAGAGGLGEGNAPACTGGKAGAMGTNGAHGLGAAGWVAQSTDSGPWPHVGRLTVDGYVGMPGEDGKSGAPGQGGGGGGATFGSVAVCGATQPGGAAGGSGGAGGCGGQGGRGGQAGGASIGVAMRNWIAIFETVITAGNGGNAGNGAPGQPGGTGGAGASGGGGSGTIAPGCKGGDGGDGGDGGWGGGGQGGQALSIGVLIALMEGDWPIHSDMDSKLYFGEAGAGGDGAPDPDWDGKGTVAAATIVQFLAP